MSALEEPRHTPIWTLGERMQKARESADMTREEMVDKLRARGIHGSVSAIYKWEGDNHLPSTRRGKAGEPTVTTLDVLRAWADITNVDRDFLNPFTSTSCYAQGVFDIDTAFPALTVVS